MTSEQLQSLPFLDLLKLMVEVNNEISRRNPPLPEIVVVKPEDPDDDPQLWVKGQILHAHLLDLEDRNPALCDRDMAACLPEIGFIKVDI